MLSLGQENRGKPLSTPISLLIGWREDTISKPNIATRPKPQSLKLRQWMRFVKTGLVGSQHLVTNLLRATGSKSIEDMA